MIRGTVLLLVLILAPGVLFAGSVASSPGVGVDVSSIVVNEALRPGGTYTLPEIGVINSGDEPLQYEITVHPLADAARDPDSRWFRFEPDRFLLDTGETRRVAISLALPAGAEPGDYTANLEAHPVPAGGQTVGIAVATELRFSIEPSSWFDAQLRRADHWLDQRAPWSYFLPALLLGTLLALRYGRRVPYRVRVERR